MSLWLILVLVHEYMYLIYSCMNIVHIFKQSTQRRRAIPFDTDGWWTDHQALYRHNMLSRMLVLICICIFYLIVRATLRNLPSYLNEASIHFPLYHNCSGPWAFKVRRTHFLSQSLFSTTYSFRISVTEIESEQSKFYGPIELPPTNWLLRYLIRFINFSNFGKKTNVYQKTEWVMCEL